MTDDLTYKDYVSDDAHMAAYSEYQRRYSQNIRESDKVLIETVRGLKSKYHKDDERLTLLDIGCSTGNLLLHIRHALPDLRLFGGDIVSSAIEECKSRPALSDIQFAEMDMLDLKREGQFDFVVANAAMMFFNEDEFERATRSIAAAVRDGGWFVAFDYFHPFEQEVTVIEKSSLHPNGLKFYLRSYAKVKSGLEKARFSNLDFRPFHIPIDLGRADDETSIGSYTVRSDDGNRMSFRGTLFQPWCHLVARKSG